MADFIVIVTVLLLCYGGWCLWAISQQRFWTTVVGLKGDPTAEPLRRIILWCRVCGSLLLILALGIALIGQGGGFGSLLWVLSLSLGALATVATLTWWTARPPKSIKPHP